MMAVSGNSKICPRCNTVLPASASFCGSCGYPLASSPDAPQGTSSIPDDAPTQYSQPDAPFAPGNAANQESGPGAAEGWPQQSGDQPLSQQGFEPQNPPGSIPPPPPPPAQAEQASYPAAPRAAPPRRRDARKWIAAALVAAIVIAGASAAWFLYLSPSRCSGPLFDRHGLQSNVPLPSNCAYKSRRTFRSAPSAIPQVQAEEWFWTVDKPGDVAAIQQFYDTHLASNGWIEKHPSALSSSDPRAKSIYACQGNQVLFIVTAPKIPVTDNRGNITFTLEAPPGGSALALALTTSRSFYQTVCSDK